MMGIIDRLFNGGRFLCVFDGCIFFVPILCRVSEKKARKRVCMAREVAPRYKVEGALAKNQGEVQTISGEMPCWWDGTQSVENDAFMLTRHAEPLITAAEKFSAINDLLLAGYDYPRLAVNTAWKGKLWVHEHNWGGTDGDISDAIKLATARETFRLADDLVAATLDSLVSNIRCRNSGIPLIVFNSLAWPRTDVVDHIITLDKPGVRNLRLLDTAGKNVPLQIRVQATHADGSIARAQVVFVAQVPAIGYATYYFAPGTRKTATMLSASRERLENQFFKVQIDTTTGGIVGIFDKTNNREILNNSTYQGNELIALENLGVDEAEEFTDKSWRMSEKPAAVTLVESGPVRATIRVKGLIMNSGRTQEISLYASVPRIDLKTILNWDGQGIILRCYETDGRDTDVSIQFPMNLARATRTNIIEENQTPIAVEKGGVINVHVGKYAIETIRLEFE